MILRMVNDAFYAADIWQVVMVVAVVVCALRRLLICQRCGVHLSVWQNAAIAFAVIVACACGGVRICVHSVVA